MQNPSALTPKRGLGLSGLALLIVFMPAAFGCVESWSISVALILMAATAYFAARLPAPEGPSLVPAALWLAALAGVQALFFAKVTDPSSLHPFSPNPYRSLQAMLLWAGYALLLWSAPKLVRSKSEGRLILTIAFATGVAVALMGLEQRSYPEVFIYGLRRVRRGAAFGPFYNRDHAATMMTMAASCGWALIFDWWRKSPRSIMEKWARVTLLGALVATTHYAVFRTTSRGAMLSTACGVAAGMSAVIFATWREGARPWGKVAAVLALPALGVWKLLGPALAVQDKSVAFRLSMYSSAWQAIRDFPLFGAGLGAVLTAFRPYQDTLIDEGMVEHIHSDWLEIVYAGGLLGSMPYLLTWIATARWLLLRIPALPPGPPQWSFAALLGGLAAFATHGLVDFSFQTPAVGMLAFLILSLLRSPGLFSDADRIDEDHRRLAPRTPMILVALLVMIGALWIGYSGRGRPRWSNPQIEAEFQDALTLYNGAGDPEKLRRALAAAEGPYDFDPLDPRFRSLYAAILAKLNRGNDARALGPTG